MLPLHIHTFVDGMEVAEMDNDKMRSVEAFQRLHPEAFFRRFLKHQVRPDGRKLLQSRKMTITAGCIASADGSALVRLGSTTVVAGVKLEVTTPAQDTPNEGEIDINVQLWPMCSPKFSIGSPPEEAVSLANFLKRTVASTGAVDMSSLCIGKGKLCWVMKVDLVCLDHDGNLMDAALAALMAALHNVRIPAHEIEEDETTVVLVPGPSEPLRILHTPLSLTFGLFDNTLLTDPSAKEEELLDSIVTVAQNQKGQICGIYKPGGAQISTEDLRKCIHLAREHVKSLATSLDTAVLKPLASSS